VLLYSYNNQCNKTSPDSRSYDQIEHAFSATHWTFHIRKKHETMKLTIVKCLSWGDLKIKERGVNGKQVWRLTTKWKVLGKKTPAALSVTDGQIVLKIAVYLKMGRY